MITVFRCYSWTSVNAFSRWHCRAKISLYERVLSWTWSKAIWQWMGEDLQVRERWRPTNELSCITEQNWRQLLLDQNNIDSFREVRNHELDIVAQRNGATSSSSSSSLSIYFPYKINNTNNIFRLLRQMATESSGWFSPKITKQRLHLSKLCRKKTVASLFWTRYICGGPIS